MAEMEPENLLLYKRLKNIESPEDLNRGASELQQYFMVKSQLSDHLRHLRIGETNRAGPNKQKNQRVDPSDSFALKGLYRDQAHRAVQEIIFGPSFYCIIEDKKIEDRYISLLSKNLKSKISSLPPHLWKKPAPKEDCNNSLVAPFTKEEVRQKLLAKIHCRLTNSKSVGLDRLTFKHLFHHDSSCMLLTALYNACLRLKAVPITWKETYSVLIRNQKNVDINDPDITKWKSVTLMNTTPKLFQALLASRLVTWAQDTGRLSPTQKSILLTQASCEGSFIVQECKKYAQACKENLLIAWLDFKDAAKNIPQEAVMHALKKHGVPQSIQDIIGMMIIGTQTKIKTNSREGYTKLIDISHGLPDGAPLNPILINLVIEPVLRDLNRPCFKNKFKIFHEKINHFAIPDELTLIANSPAELQKLLDSVGKNSEYIGLKFNTNKCSAYYYNGKENQVKETGFLFAHQKLKSVTEENINDYFGVRQGLSIGQDGIPSIEEAVEHVEAICRSDLDQFQKNDAIHTFILPRLSNCLKGLQNVDDTYLTEVDLILRDKIQKCLDLPGSPTSESVVYHTYVMMKGEAESQNRKNQTSLEGKYMLMAFIPILDLYNIMKIVHAYEMLNSEDKKLRRIARCSLKSEISFASGKTQKDIKKTHLASFLDGNDGLKYPDSTTLWQGARGARLYLTDKICLSWRFDGSDAVIRVKQNPAKRFWKKKKGYKSKIGDDIKKALVQFYVEKVENSATRK